jgi:AhpC/TSA family
MGDSWAVLFSHPKDFTPVCTSELGYMARIKSEFDRRNVKVIGLSIDSIEDHQQWADDIEETEGYAPNYPIISDGNFRVSKMFAPPSADRTWSPPNMLSAAESLSEKTRDGVDAHRLCITLRCRRRERANRFAETLRARCDVRVVIHAFRSGSANRTVSLVVLRGRASLPKISSFMHRSSLIGNAVNGSVDGAMNVSRFGIRVMCCHRRHKRI